QPPLRSETNPVSIAESVRKARAGGGRAAPALLHSKCVPPGRKAPGREKTVSHRVRATRRSLQLPNRRSHEDLPLLWLRPMVGRRCLRGKLRAPNGRDRPAAVPARAHSNRCKVGRIASARSPFSGKSPERLPCCFSPTKNTSAAAFRG